MPTVKKKLANDYPWWKVRIWYGMTTSALFRLLLAYGFRCSTSRLYRLLLIGLLAPTNSVLAVIQQILYAGRVERQEQPPCIFIIGHWRTGTTFLHELLANDPRLVAPNTLQCLCPSHFLVLRWFTWFISFFSPSKRPMDSIEIRLDSPQEDEFVFLLNGAGSPYEMFGYPEERSTWASSFLPLPEKQASWLATLEQFLKGIAFEHRLSSGCSPERLLLKSPTHTARLALLARQYPTAKFIHLTRNPLDLFSSTGNMVFALITTQSLKLPSSNIHQLTDEIVLENLELLYANFDEDCRTLEPGRLHNLKYEDLTADPMEEAKRIYEFLEIPMHEKVIDLINADLAARRQYEAAKHSVPDELAVTVYRRWKKYFDTFGYVEASRYEVSTSKTQYKGLSISP